MVGIFDDGADIANPGPLRDGLTPKNFGKVSVIRDPVAADMFFRPKLVKPTGSGVGRMRNAAKKANVAKPGFDSDYFFKVTFKRNMI
jgi:ATP-dependent DNA helicase RecG